MACCTPPTRRPDALPLVLPDLRSRLAQCARWTLPVLDDAGRAELLRQRAAARGLDLDEAALDWLLRRCSRDLGSLTAHASSGWTAPRWPRSGG